MDIAEIIRLIGGLGKVGAGVYSAFQKEPLPYGIAQAAQAASNANTYLGASADPSSPYFRNIAETEEIRSRNDLISSIGEIIRQNATRSATGRGTINPERRDETVWGMLARGFQEAGLRAREMARQRLLEMAGASRGVAQSFGGLAQPSLMTQFLNRASRNAGMSGAFEGVNALAGMVGGGGKPSRGGDDITRGLDSTPDWWTRSVRGG